ncbi:efflux RND transporter periplasmic adaptor subunit [Pseudomonas sp. Marseille-QA0892]
MSFTPSAWPLRILLSSAVILAGCSEEPEESLPPPLVMVQKVQPVQEQGAPWRFAGVVSSVAETDVSFQVAGRLQRVRVNDGALVKRGQVLAELDDTDYQLRVRDAGARLGQISADLARKRQLLAEGILAPAAIEPIEANRVAAQVALDTARREVGYTRVTAPFDGVVAQRLVEPGAVVNAGTPVFTLQDNRFIEVSVDLPEDVALQVPFDATLEARGTVLAREIVLPLRYKEHATRPSERARTYRLTLRADRPQDVNLLPGMAMRVEIPRSQPASVSAAYQIPVSALATDEARERFVWLIVDDRVQQVPVSVNGIQDAFALVEADGLDESSRVVVAGARKLHEDQTVRSRERSE